MFFFRTSSFVCPDLPQTEKNRNINNTNLVTKKSFICKIVSIRFLEHYFGEFLKNKIIPIAQDAIDINQ